MARTGRPRKHNAKTTTLAFAADEALVGRLDSVLGTGQFSNRSTLIRLAVLRALPDIEREVGLHYQQSLFEDKT